MECKIPSALFILIVLSLVLQNKLTSANICSITPTGISGSAYGTFSSLNYPNNYPNNNRKIWKIEAPVGQHIVLYFAVFVLETSSSCQHDYVKIRGRCDDVVPMAVYCGRTARPLKSSSNVLWVEFRSDSSKNYKGFEAIYKLGSNFTVSCPRAFDNQANINYCLSGGQVQCCNNGDSNCAVNTLLTAPSGTITSPGYPGYYPHGTFYKWRITVPMGYVVQLNFTTLVTQNSQLCSNAPFKCNCDYVAALDGPCPLYHSGTKWCGGWTSQYKYPSFITTGRHMVLAFRSDLTYNHIGFVAHYRRALICSGGTPISCVSNGVPSCCRRDASVCVSGTSTRSHCPRNGDPSSYTGCCTVDGTPSCCAAIQPAYSVTCPRSSDNPSYLDVCLSRGQQICCNRNRPSCRYNVLLTDQSGIIKSPGFPSRYPHNALIVWRITVPQGFLVQLNFTTLKIERGSACYSCNCDYVGVRDGPCSDIVGVKWCGTASGTLPSFISTGRHLQVFFKSDSANSFDGFVAKYRRALKCGGDKPYSCLQQGQPSCCRTAGSSVVFSSRTLWIAMVIISSSRMIL